MITFSFLRQAMGSLLIAMTCIGCSSNSIDIFQSTEKYRATQNYENYLTAKLKKDDVQYVKYGDTRTLIIPMDRYFIIDSNEFSDNNCKGLEDSLKLIKLYPKSHIFVAGFNDDIGSPSLQRHLTQGRADRVLTYLWTHGIPAKRMSADGYGYLFPLGSNRQIHSSAYNRRIEIQWSKSPKSCCMEPKAESSNWLNVFSMK